MENVKCYILENLHYCILSWSSKSGIDKSSFPEWANNVTSITDKKSTILDLKKALYNTHKKSVVFLIYKDTG